MKLKGDKIKYIAENMNESSTKLSVGLKVSRSTVSRLKKRIRMPLQNQKRPGRQQYFASIDEVYQLLMKQGISMDNIDHKFTKILQKALKNDNPNRKYSLKKCIEYRNQLKQYVSDLKQSEESRNRDQEIESNLTLYAQQESLHQFDYGFFHHSIIGNHDHQYSNDDQFLSFSNHTYPHPFDNELTQPQNMINYDYSSQNNFFSFENQTQHSEQNIPNIYDYEEQLFHQSNIYQDNSNLNFFSPRKST